MAKHEHSIQVEKQEGMQCDGCGSVHSKTTSITGYKGITGVPRTLYFCSRCLAWLKGKLMGF